MDEKRSATEILEYCEAAGQAPWRQEHGMTGSFVVDADERYLIGGERFESVHDFIANARTDLPAVTKAAVELRRALNKVAGKLVWPEEPGWREGAIALLDCTTWLEPIEEV